METLYALAGMFAENNGSNVESEIDTESLPDNNSTALLDQQESHSANATTNQVQGCSFPHGTFTSY